MTDRCRSCLEPIRWERTAAGRAIPLDPDPVPEGNIIISDGHAIVFASAARVPTGDDVPRYVSHFVSCKDAADWRGKR